VGDPYGDLEYCLATATAGAAGNQINIKAGTDEVLAASLDLATDFGAPTQTNSLRFRGYTSTADDGGIGAVDCNSNSLFASTGYDYVSLISLELHTFGSAEPVHLDQFATIINCEIHGSSHSSYIVDITTGGFMQGCYVHSHTGTGQMLLLGTGAHCEDSFFDCGANKDGINCSGAYSRCRTTVVKAAGASISYGIQCTGNASSADNCSVYNSAAATTIGIKVTQKNNVVKNCIVEGWSGTGGNGIETTATDFNQLIAGNRFYNCATNLVTNIPAIEFDNSTLAASAFADPSTNDFTVGTEVKGAGWPASIGEVAASTTFLDQGACQREEAGGGGVPGNTRGGMQ